MDAERDMTGDGVAEEGARPEALRAAMVEELRQLGSVRSDPVERAFRVAPRHLFSPEAPLMEAYGVNRSVVVKRDDDGTALSTVSAPSMQADMLEQAEVRPGMRVLEIGSGGVNAAMLAELVGSEGHVTTVDIDADVTERARRGLAESGYDQVRVVRADAEHGVADQAPYHRILVTVGVWDIPPAWLDQLADRGRLIVPLRLRGGDAVDRAGTRGRPVDQSERAPVRVRAGAGDGSPRGARGAARRGRGGALRRAAAPRRHRAQRSTGHTS
ncbi:methyltransferase domain-containing protein [Actinopolyspora erythraea]|uniref:methyltransferase domain-containing protein n=1 Tax=Actinopolyspora erythraea TaxID=414996 RepID=UPI000A83DE72|nr:methyltransferase domain-containing protein [Actinopolyspora erythraea]